MSNNKASIGVGEIGYPLDLTVSHPEPEFQHIGHIRRLDGDRVLEIDSVNDLSHMPYIIATLKLLFNLIGYNLKIGLFNSLFLL